MVFVKIIKFYFLGFNVSDVYSSHIFMFPFRFDWIKEGFDTKFDFYKEWTIDKRVYFQKIQKDLEKDWNYRPFELEKSLEESHLQIQTSKKFQTFNTS